MKPVSDPAAKVLLSTVIVLLAVAAMPVAHWEGDFLSFYAGARLAGTPQLFSVDAVHRIEAPLERHPEEIRAWIRPPFYALLLSPLGRLPYKLAACLWQALLAVALVIFIRLWDGRVQSYLAGALFVPMLAAFLSGQDIALLLLLAAVGLRLEERGKPFSAGMVLALCAIKAHLLLLLPLWIVARRLWRVALGLCTGGAILALVCALAQGRDWIARYLEVLAMNEARQASQDYMVSLMGLLHDAPRAVLWLASLLLAAGCYLAQRRLSKRDGLALALFGGVLVAPHAFVYDLAFLLPALMDRRAAAAAAAAVCFLISVPALAVCGRLLLVAMFMGALRIDFKRGKTNYDERNDIISVGA